MYASGREWRRDGGRIERETDREGEREREWRVGGGKEREPNSTWFTWTID